MFVDLHVHSWYSDSTRSPEEVAREAKAQGIGRIALCDHNTVAGHAAMAAACAAQGIEWTPGVEIDAAYAGGDQHLLAYGCDFAHPPLAALLAENLRNMEQVSIDLIARMRAEDSRLDPEEYAGYARDPARGGWKGIDYLRGKGYEIRYPDCMALYARHGCRPSPFAPVEQVARLVREAGGYVVLAHPGDRLPQEGFTAHLERLAALGVGGVECYYPSHSEAVRAVCRDFCAAHGLRATAGSDDHGSFAEWVNGVHYALGVIRVEEDCL